MKKNSVCKKCGKQLPEGYKYNRCEWCRNERAHKQKTGIKAGAGMAVLLSGLALIAKKAAENSNKTS